MATPTIQFSSATRYYVATHSVTAAKIAALLGISNDAIIGAVANEYDTRYNFDGNPANLLSIGPLQNVADWYFNGDIGDLGRGFVRFFGFEPPSAYTHQDLLQNYNDYKSGNHSVFGLLGDPVVQDIGPGNFRIETAIDLITDYSNRYQGTGNDPLGLLKYTNDYALLTNDMGNFTDPTTTFALTGLYLTQAKSFFISKSSSAWSALSPDEQDALLVTYYKLGEEAIEKNIDRKIAEAYINGTVFTYDPTGDGGLQHLNNLHNLKTWQNDHCFPAQTPILLANNTTKPIADITIGDTVMAFNGMGDLTPRKVTKLYRNTTDEWLELTFADGRESLVVTPGHEFLTPEGTFAPIEKLATFGGKAILALMRAAVNWAKAKGVAETRVELGAEAMNSKLSRVLMRSGFGVGGVSLVGGV